MKKNISYAIILALLTAFAGVNVYAEALTLYKCAAACLKDKDNTVKLPSAMIGGTLSTEKLNASPKLETRRTNKIDAFFSLVEQCNGLGEKLIFLTNRGNYETLDKESPSLSLEDIDRLCKPEDVNVSN